MPGATGSVITVNVARRITLITALVLFFINAAFQLYPWLIGDEAFESYALFIAGLWGSCSSASFLLLYLYSRNVGANVNASGSGVAVDHAWRVGLLLTLPSIVIIYAIGASGKLEHGMLAAFLMLFLPVIVTPIVLSSYRTKRNELTSK